MPFDLQMAKDIASDNSLERLNKFCGHLTYKHKKNRTKFGTTRRFAFCLKWNRFDFKCGNCLGEPI